MDCLANPPSEKRVGGVPNPRQPGGLGIGADGRANARLGALADSPGADALRQSYRPKANTPLFVVIATYCRPPAA